MDLKRTGPGLAWWVFLLVAAIEPAGAAEPFLVVLGVAQDGGFPQAGCKKDCCARAWKDPALRRHVACLAVVDPDSAERWLVDATPDFREQLRLLDAVQPVTGTPGLAGILLTHGHVGHYTGLMHLGREAIGAKGVPVYAMPRMEQFLRHNGPWDLLVRLENITLRPVEPGARIPLNARLGARARPVPHRDEYTETVAWHIDGPSRSALFIPDIDKWEKWDRRIEDLLAEVDVAYLDGTFYADGELPGRSIAEIPHPFITESLERFAALPAAMRSKVRFIHLNHTNPALAADSAARRQIEAAGMHVAEQTERFGL